MLTCLNINLLALQPTHLQSWIPLVHLFLIRLSIGILSGLFSIFTFTRPDIAYVVHQVCLYMHDPREPHFTALKRILRYIQGTIDHGLQLYSSPSRGLIAYFDTDWADCPSTRRSTSGYCVFLGQNLISWSSKRHGAIFRSSAEAKFRGVDNVVAETCCHVGFEVYFVNFFNRLLVRLLCIVIMLVRYICL